MVGHLSGEARRGFYQALIEGDPTIETGALAVLLGRPAVEFIDAADEDAIINAAILHRAQQLRQRELEAFGVIVANKVAELFAQMFASR